MTFSDFRRAALICLAGLGWTPPAGAFAIYTDRPAWTAAVTAAIATDTFSNPIAFGQSIGFDSGVTSTGSGTNSTVLSDSNTVAGGRYNGRVDTFNHSRNTFAILSWNFPGLIFALGGDWVGTATGGGLTLTGNFDGTGDQTVNFLDQLGSPGTGFLGIVGAGAFGGITLGTQSNHLDEFFFLDNLSFARQSVAEPPPCWLLALGLASIGLVRRTPRRSVQGTAGANQLCSDSPPSTTISAPVT